MSKRYFLLLNMVLFFFALFFPMVAFADIPWYRPEDMRTPSVYGGRVYTREHLTNFWYNEMGFNLGPTSPGTSSIGSMYCSVFDLPGDLSQGYTALSDKDISNNPKVGNNFGATDILPKLQGFNVPQDTTTGDYIISPSYWAANTPVGQKSLFWGQGDGQKNVPITISNIALDGSKPFIDPIYTKTNPFCISNGDSSNPTFQAGGYDGSTPKYWWSGNSSTNGNINLTKDAAALMYNSDKATSADICFSYIYGVSVMTLNPTKTGVNVGDQETWTASIINTTPYEAVNVNLRAYLIKDGESKPTLVNYTQVPSIKALPIGSGQTLDQNAYAFYFSYPLPDKGFKVLVTANLDCTNGLGTASNPEPLTTKLYYGAFKGNYVYGSTGKMETINYLDFVQTLGLGTVAYNDNFQLSDAYSSGSSGHSTSPNPGPTSNLMADDVSYDTNIQRATATFHSTFSSGGSVIVRFFQLINGGTSITQCGSSQAIHINANGSITANLNNYFISNGSILYATINLDRGGTSWVSSKFNADSGGLQEETSYDDNKVATVVGAAPPPPPPTTVAPEIHPSTYHPMKKVPRYKTIQVPVWKDEWIRVEIDPGNPPKGFVRLIPNPGEPGGPVEKGNYNQ